MRKYAFLIIISLLVAVNMAYAEECASSDMRQMTLYNPAHLEAIFGTAPLCENGLVHIKTTIGEGRGAREWDIGYLYGNIETREGSKRMLVNEGSFMSASGNRAMINVTGGQFAINAENKGNLLFDVSKAAYFKNYYFFVRKDEECNMLASLTPVATYLNITGEGIAIFNLLYSRYKAGEELEDKYLNRVSNLYGIDLSNATYLEMQALTKGRSGFGDIEVSSDEKIKLRRYYHVQLNPEGGQTGYMDIVFANNAQIFGNEGQNLGISVRDETKPASLKLSMGNEDIIEIAKGALMAFKDNSIYEACAVGQAENLKLNSGVCAFFDKTSGLIRLKPWRTKITTTIETLEGETISERTRGKPIYLTLTYPAVSAYNNLYLKEFEANDIDSRVVVEKQGIAGSMAFSRDDVVMEGGANWYDFGTSFKSLIYDAGNKFYSLFECVLSERQCYFDGTLVSGEFRRMRGQIERCNSNADCGEGRECMQKLCVRQASCQRLTNVNAGGEPANSVDIVFVSDRYMKESDFLRDVGYAVNGDGTHIGILTVDPFSLQKEKFNIWAIYTGETMLPMDSSMRSELTPAERYINSMGMNCPSGDRIITLSGLDFGVFANFGGNAYVSRAREGEWFTAATVHEFGHSFGQLRDEYNQSKAGETSACYAGPPNCVVASAAIGTYGWTPENAAEAVSNNWRGCGGECGRLYNSYLRPSFNSIMRYPEETGGDVFNTPSKAWIQRILDRY
ncbi:MAG: M64 family metallopeptidase [Nanoarchaeota archaeon]|nr:M64 family metallopeptidase [Nanoarchaeota archaeon]